MIHSLSSGWLMISFLARQRASTPVVSLSTTVSAKRSPSFDELRTRASGWLAISSRTKQLLGALPGRRPAVARGRDRPVSPDRGDIALPKAKTSRRHCNEGNYCCSRMGRFPSRRNVKFLNIRMGGYTRLEILAEAKMNAFILLNAPLAVLIKAIRFMQSCPE